MNRAELPTIRCRLLLVAMAATACTSGSPAADPPLILDVDSASSDDPIAPLPLQSDLDARKVALGERLFHDPVLSGDGRVACDACHDRRLALTDGQPRPNV